MQAQMFKCLKYTSDFTHSYTYRIEFTENISVIVPETYGSQSYMPRPYVYTRAFWLIGEDFVVDTKGQNRINY